MTNQNTTTPSAQAANETPPAPPRGEASKGKIAGALAKAQGEFEPLEKTKTAKVPMKSGGTYSYSYADLADVMRCCRKALSANELAITQGIVGDELITTLLHSSGEWLRSAIPLVQAQGQGPQALGSMLTYCRRYGACALLGIVAEEDDDAQVAEDNRKGGGRAAPPKREEEGPPAAEVGDGAKIRQGMKTGDFSAVKATEPQHKRMWALTKEAGYDQTQFKDLLFSMFGNEVEDAEGKVTTKNLTKGQMDKIYKVLERDAADRKKKK